VQPTAQVNVSAPGAALAGFQVSINGRFWVSTEARWAQRLEAKAKRYLDLGGGDPRPPAAALAMPIPPRPSFTAAIGFPAEKPPPNDAA